MTDIDSHADAAFTAANDWSKQVLTLSTAILATTISLGETLFGDLTGVGMGSERMHTLTNQVAEGLTVFKTPENAARCNAQLPNCD